MTYVPSAYDRITEVEIEAGLHACIIGIEDILTSRIYAGIDENRTNDLGWAAQMVALHYDRIDWTALETLASLNGPRILAEVQRLRAQGPPPCHAP